MRFATPRVVEPGHVSGAVREPQLAPGQQVDEPAPELHRAGRIGAAVDQEGRLLDRGQLRVVEGEPASQSRAQTHAAVEAGQGLREGLGPQRALAAGQMRLLGGSRSCWMCGSRAVAVVGLRMETEEAVMATTGSTPPDGGSALDRLGGSLDAAQDTLKDLRRALSKGGRDLIADLDVLVRDARKNLRGAQRALVKDLDEVQKAAAGKRATAKRAPAKRSTATKRTGAASSRKPSGTRTRAARKP
jgi:hypothetical protein